MAVFSLIVGSAGASTLSTEACFVFGVFFEAGELWVFSGMFEAVWVGDTWVGCDEDEEPNKSEKLYDSVLLLVEI